MSTPPPFCSITPECDRRFEEMAAHIRVLDERTRIHGESIAALRAQVAAYAAMGSLVGGGLVSLVTHWLK